MPATGTESRTTERALVGLVESLQRLQATPVSSPLLNKRAAAKRLGVSMRELRELIALDLVDTVRVGRRELVFL